MNKITFLINGNDDTALFRLQRDVHLELCRSGGYYIFKKGSKFVKIDANEVTGLIKDKNGALIENIRTNIFVSQIFDSLLYCVK